MSNPEITSKVQELRELRRIADDLAKEIEAITDAIKQEMTTRQADEIAGADWKITWKPVTSTRFDSTAFRKARPDLAAQYMKETTTRRFLVA